MNQSIVKPLRFLWRCGRNVLSFFPFSRQLLFPPQSLAERFGRGDAQYAWNVFHHHREQLDAAGFTGAGRVLEVGPGRNLGTALLWWCHLSAQAPNNTIEVICWDVFTNVDIKRDRYWSELAGDLLVAISSGQPRDAGDTEFLAILHKVADEQLTPNIAYRVEPISHFERAQSCHPEGFDLIYSHAALEHVWLIDAFWNSAARLSSQRGWHSHRIDLADHGRRETNYVEMLEWSGAAYWMMMRFIPGATNRWRACHHLSKLASLGFEIPIQRATLNDRLPIPGSRISAEFRELGEMELRAVALDVVARSRSRQS